MTIYRKIFRVDVKRTKHGLEYDLTELPAGVNVKALEYEPDETTPKTCVIETWCSDHPLVSIQKGKSELAKVKGKNIQALASHPKSPPILGQIMEWDDVTKKNVVIDEG